MSMEQVSIFSFTQPKVYTVSELTLAIKDLLEAEFPVVWVEGEISNARRPLSGHLYFTLKDDKAQLGALLFKNSQKALKFKIEDGLKVICQGHISVYPPHGNYRLIVEYIEPKGYGALQLAFEQLKRKLAEEGLFDAEFKRPLPLLPRRIAVVTSPSGAAIRDFLRVLLKRFPNVQVRIFPVKVQGEGAAQEIAYAIKELNRLGWAEVIVVTRGGGSLEDLWAFNEEIVARAIFKSKIPVVSAVGHEVDFTISDLVADLRAPTPTAAAEMIVQKKEDLEKMLADVAQRLPLSLKRRLQTQRLHLEHLFKRLQSVLSQLRYTQIRLDDLSQQLLRAFNHRLQTQIHSLGHLQQRLYLAHPLRRIQEIKNRLQTQLQTLINDFSHFRQQKKAKLEQLESSLNALDPKSILKRGYALVFDNQNRLVKSINQVAIEDRITINLADGTLKGKVEDKNVSKRT